MKCIKALAFLCLLAVTFVKSTEEDSENPWGKRVLAVLENSELKSSHSIFFKSIEERGYSVDYVTASDRGLALRKYGEWLYDHLVLFAPSADDLNGISEQDIVEFIDDGKNVVVAADSNIGSLVANIASECNVEFDEKETSVIDHFHFDVSDYHGKHDLIVSDNVVDAPAIFGGKPSDAPILFRGVSQDIEEDSPLLFPILTGYATTYSSSSETIENLHVAGKKTVLVSALQARNNARVLFSGSLDLFSDKFFTSAIEQFSASGSNIKHEKSGNENFAKQLIRWTFKERGVLRVKSVEHHKAGETLPPSVYTIKEDIQYTIEIEEWKGKKWVAFNADDVQLEFVRLDPYVRTTLKSDGNGKYTTTFKVPDVYGIYTFKVDYNRVGFGHLNSITRVPVRPFRHNEYERFIGAAFPYYAGAFSMMGGLFVFSWFFLYHKDKKSAN